MYELDDTIIAVSTPTADKQVIVRVSGPEAVEVTSRIFSPPISLTFSGLHRGRIKIDNQLSIDARIYLFNAPNSYTGDDVLEIHLYANQPVIQELIKQFLNKGFRTAQPGEFTARAYLNGKIDLTQAEAVNEIITSSNNFQLAAGEQLLAGKLAKTTAEIREQIIDCLSLLEAGFDFCTEDIEFISNAQAIDRLDRIKEQLDMLLEGSINCETIVDLPAVAIAGAPNAGKSSLLNKLLGTQRSIVSPAKKTTRDILSGKLELERSNAVLFDCAGLLHQPTGVIDQLTQNAATKAIANSSMVIFCVDLSKNNWSEDLEIRELVCCSNIITAATKSDLLSKEQLKKSLSELNRLFGADFLAVSIKTCIGLFRLRQTIDKKIIELAAGTVAESRKLATDTKPHIALTARHRQAVTDAIESINEAIGQLEAGNDEITAMMMRAAYQTLTDIERKPIDEKLLENIFSRFCIGK